MMQDPKNPGTFYIVLAFVMICFMDLLQAVEDLIAPTNR